MAIAPAKRINLSMSGSSRLMRLVAIVAEPMQRLPAGSSNRCRVVALNVPVVRFKLRDSSMAGLATELVPVVDGVAEFSFPNPKPGVRYSILVDDPDRGIAPFSSYAFAITEAPVPAPEPAPEPAPAPTPAPAPAPTPLPVPTPEPPLPVLKVGAVDLSKVKLGEACRVPVTAVGMDEFEFVVVKGDKDWTWRSSAKKEKASAGGVDFVPVEVGDRLRVQMPGNTGIVDFTEPVPASAAPTPPPAPAPAPNPVPTPAPGPEPSPGGAGLMEPPTGWPQVFRDDFTRPAQWGPDAVDPSKWGHRTYGGSAHQGSSTWNNGRNLEATGNTVRLHVTKNNGRWLVDGFQNGAQNKDRNGYAFHAGWGEFHFRYRARLSHAFAPGVGGYCLMWPASNNWSSELDWMETPKDQKTRSDATMHWDKRGQFNLDQDNTTAHVETTLDLSQWHIWDCRRTYRSVNGKTAATITMWIDGKKIGQPSGWIDNPYMAEDMMFGAATYVAAQGQTGWYGLPKSNTPTDSWLELDYVHGWAPK